MNLRKSAVRSSAVRSLELALVTVAVLLLVGQLVGQPVLLGYVETGSMAPTLDRGDGFVAVPTVLAGPIAVGDVVTFRAERLHGGSLTTHRVVAVTDEGFLTRGDANVFTDQESGAREPPVQRSRVVAVALTVGDSVVVVPHLGTVVATLQGVMGTLQVGLVAVFGPSVTGSTTLSVVLAVAGIGLYVVSTARGRRRSAEADVGTETIGRSLRAVVEGFSPAQVVTLLAAVLVVATTASMLLPGGVHEVGIVSAENDAPGPRVIEHGTSETATYAVANGGLLPTVSYIEPEGDALAVTPREVYVRPRGRGEATVTVHAPEAIGYYRYRVVEHRYLAVLPVPVIRGLYTIHPWAPIVVIDIVLVGVALVLSVLVLHARPDGTLRGFGRSIRSRLR